MVIHWFIKQDEGQSGKKLAMWEEILQMRKAISFRWFIESLLKC